MKMVHLSLFAVALAFIAVSLAGCGDDKKDKKEGSAASTTQTTTTTTANPNPCHGKKPKHANATAKDNYFANTGCAEVALDQAGTNVTKGYKGSLDASGRKPITTSYKAAGLCPVNVHWHLGAEHLSVGQYDEKGKGPKRSRRLAAKSVRGGFQCHHYNASDSKFTKPYAWKHCVGMKVGETYEVHWPHSAAGQCNTEWQYQTPFYDGVFCKDGIISLNPLNTFQKIGVQAQVYTIVNDEKYYYADMFKGWKTDKNQEITYYTGSTTGTSRNNEICSRYTPITWQVDRNCHMISASSFDKMCEEMKKVKDDMKNDLHAHGARELVNDTWAANNHQRLLLL